MNGVAWVVEVKETGKWEVLSVRRSRRLARNVAAMFRAANSLTRVRQYVRVEEVK